MADGVAKSKISDYPYKCECGKDGWTTVEGIILCQKCYKDLRKNAPYRQKDNLREQVEHI